MKQNRIVLGKDMKACVDTANGFDAKIGDFGHTPEGRDRFSRGPRRKCSKLQAVPCALFLTLGKICLRLEKSIGEIRP